MRTIRIPLRLELGVERAVREAVDEAFKENIRAESVTAYIDPNAMRPASGLIPVPDATLGLKKVQTKFGLVDVKFGPENCLVVVAIE